MSGGSTSAITNPEMAGCVAELRATVRVGTRRQDPLSPQKYRYMRKLSDLPEDNTHVEAIVPFRFGEGADGDLAANNYVVTAYSVTMPDPQKKYDEPSDTLHIAFMPGESATGIELNENILLRIDKRERVAVGLSIFNYSVLAQRTELGLRSVPLSGGGLR